MDYVLKSSLERIALTKIAVALWNQVYVSAATTTHLPPDFRKTEEIMWLKAEDKVITKLSGLLLPEPLKKKILKFISGIGLEIFKWRVQLYEKYDVVIALPIDLCWTPHGTVDTKKTAEAFIQNENIDVTHRYRLACHYCLEDDIPKLWDKIPENLREQFDYRERDLVFYWTCCIKGEMEKLYDEMGIGWGNPTYKYEFKSAAFCCNIVGCEYFLQRLTHEEREVSLMTCAKTVKYITEFESRRFPIPLHFPNVLCFVLSQMNEWNQIKIYKEEPHEVLKCLLEWPWQPFFVETANRIRNFLSKNHFYNVLLAIVDVIEKGRRDYDYRKLFEEFWQQSPNAHKKAFIDNKSGFARLLSALFMTEDIGNVRLIFKSATVEEGKDIICSRIRNYTCRDLVFYDGWNSLKLLFQEFLSSKEVAIEFKKEFEEHIVRKMSRYTRKKYEWSKLYQLLDDFVQADNNKRSVEEAGESTSANRLRGTTEFEDITHVMKLIDLEE